LLLHHDDAKTLVKSILTSDVKFEGHFDKCFDNLKETQQQEIIIWVKSCKDMGENPIQSKIDRQKIGFVKRIGSNVRVLLTKEKTGYFIALFLDKHKYYEDEMNKQGF
jgi:hypothetical protein